MSRSEHWAISVPKADLLCPICRDIIRDVYCTPCGHSFCYACIMRNLEHRQLCPCCSQFVTKDKLYPNTLLAKVRARGSRGFVRPLSAPPSHECGNGWGGGG